MATPEFRAVLRIYRLPEGDLYDADLPASARGQWKHNGGAYTYNGDKPLGYFFDVSQLELIDEITEPNSLTAEFEATGISSWSMSQTYPPRSDIAAYLLENVRPSLADRPRVFAALKIITSDDPDTTDSFDDVLLGNVVSQVSDYSAANTDADGDTLYVKGISAMPEWTRRGISGPVLECGWRPVEAGIEITLRGGSAAWWAQATAQLADPIEIAVNPIAGLIAANATVTLPEFAESLFGTANAAGNQDYQITLDDAALADELIISAAALNCLVVSDESTGTTSTAPNLSAGGHNLLQTIQRITESKEKWLDGRTPILRVRDFGGTEAAPKLVWDEADIYPNTGGLNDRLPRATSFNSKQSDYRRNWNVFSSVPELVRSLGHIMMSNVSVAPKPQSFQDEPTWNSTATRASILSTSDQLILNYIKAQNKANALREADNLFGDFMVRWGDGSRVGLDFDLGDIVEVRFGGTHDAFSTVRGTRRGLVIRKIVIALDGNRRWGVSVGLGALADVAPGFSPDAVSAPMSQPKRETTIPDEITYTPDESTHTPEPVQQPCPEGMVRDPATGQCVPAADFFAGWNFGGGNKAPTGGAPEPPLPIGLPGPPEGGDGHAADFNAAQEVIPGANEGARDDLLEETRRNAREAARNKAQSNFFRQHAGNAGSNENRAAADKWNSDWARQMAARSGVGGGGGGANPAEAAAKGTRTGTGRGMNPAEQAAKTGTGSVRGRKSARDRWLDMIHPGRRRR